MPDNIAEEKQLFLEQSDIELVRVLEDLVDVLTQKGVILFTELPEAAQQKLLRRKSARQVVQNSILNEDDMMF